MAIELGSAEAARVLHEDRMKLRAEKLPSGKKFSSIARRDLNRIRSVLLHEDNQREAIRAYLEQAVSAILEVNRQERELLQASLIE